MKDQSPCSIARSLDVLGERWTLLIMRDAMGGATRFSQFRDGLGIASDVLSARLAALVEAGVFTVEPYQEPGSRARNSYQLTERGQQLLVILGALQQWGDANVPRPEGPTMVRESADGRSLHVGYVDPSGREVPLDDVRLIRTAAYPTP